MINKCLVMLGQSQKVSDEGKVKEHVMLENESARGKIAKRSIGSAAACMHGSGNGFVDNGISVLRGLRRLKMDECTNDLSNSTMDRFNDSIGCRRVGGNLDGSDARIIQGELKIMARKFRTIVMDNMEWSWVA